jgi:cysteine desulfurase / selenocysteine lyase
MGYELLIGTGRENFPVTEHLIYLNHAAVSPLCRPAALAMKRWIDDCLEFGSLHYDQWLEAYEGVRVAAARLINANPTEIAIVKNTSEGIATVAIGLDWKAGDKVVAFEDEFPANYYPWKRLESKGVRLALLPAAAPLEAIDAAATGARLLTISFVQYLSGYRANLEAIGEICHRRDCLFFVDAIQGMGAFPIDVRKARIHALAADGHKWMLGPEGCGVLYIQRDVQDIVDPVEFGYTNVAAFADYGTRNMTLRSDAGRYECGTLNTVGCFGLRAAIEFVMETGVASIAKTVQALADQIAAGVQRKGYELAVERTQETGAGIVSFRKDGMNCRGLVSELKDKGILAAPRHGWVRASPHFYILPEEIERFISLIP